VSRLLIASLLALVFGGAQAATLDLGNVAPGAGQVRWLVDGQPAAGSLGYLAFARLERAPGTLHVVALASDERVLAEADVDLQPQGGEDALLLLTGNGSDEAPFALRFNDDAPAPEAKTVRAHVAAHHAAPFAGATGTEGFEARGACRSNGVTLGDVAVGRYGDSESMALDVDPAGADCDFKTADPRFGSFDLQVAPLLAGTLRFLLVGDGVLEPPRVLVLQNGSVQQVAAESMPVVGTVLRSEDFWFDLARPAQGVSLYEIAGSDDVFGTWFTHDDSGKPVWYLLEGVASAGMPQQRELIVQQPQRSEARTALQSHGTARLFYVDCNTAELRILMGERDYYTLRLKRSREVMACDALPSPAQPQ